MTYKIQTFAEIRQRAVAHISNTVRGVSPADRMNDFLFYDRFNQFIETEHRWQMLSPTARSEIYAIAKYRFQHRVKNILARIKYCKNRIEEREDDVKNSMSVKLTYTAKKHIKNLQTEINNLEAGKYCPKIKIDAFPIATNGLIDEDGNFTGFTGHPIPVKSTKIENSFIIEAN